MCGISGIAASDQDLISRMADLLKHRGPDDSGIFVDNLVSLCNCRLKIIDLTSRGHMPMSNEDGTIWITYNGEIFNAADLRNELETEGHTFVSDSDTECIIHGYESWGVDVVSKLNGMWGFCIYDSVNKRLFLSRDRMGVKPINFVLTNDLFAFSSELKVFAEIPELHRPLSISGLAEQLMFGFNPSRNTVLDSVFKLGAGENLVYDLVTRKIRITRFWNNFRKKEGILDLRQVERLLDQSIDLNLVSEVPVGCYLSGGIDSATVAMKWSEKYSGPLHTFTVGFEDWESETTEARELANEIGSTHHELVISSEDVASNLNELLYFHDLVTNDRSFAPNYFISKLAKKFVTVTLAGEGGDEIFGGYSYYGYFSLLERIVPSIKLRRFSGTAGLTLINSDRRFHLSGLLGSLPSRFGQNQIQTEDVIAKGFYLLRNEGCYGGFIFAYLGQLPGADYSQYIPIPWNIQDDEYTGVSDFQHVLEIDQRVLLAENYNYKADRSTSAASMEERVPFQEHRLVEYMNSLPNYMKFNETQEKIILKLIVSSKLPKVAQRKKRGYGQPAAGFGHPASKWLRESLDDQLAHSISLIKKLNVVDQGKLVEQYSRFRHKDASRLTDIFLWNVMMSVSGLERFGYI